MRSLATALLVALSIVGPAVHGAGARTARAGDDPPFDERRGNVFFRNPDRATQKQIDELIARFAEDSPLARQEARRELEEIGYWSVEPLQVALAEKEPPIRAAAALTLSAILDPRSVESFRTALYRDSTSQFVSGFAAIGLGRFRDPGAVEPLRTSLHSSKSLPVLREAAPFALARIGTREAQTLLMERIRADEGSAPAASARLLALGFFPDVAVAPDRPEPSVPLKSGLKSRRREVRRAALVAFLVATLNRTDTRDTLLRIVEGESAPEVLLPGLIGISRFEGVETTRYLAGAAANSSDDAVRVRACDLLATRADPEALEDLRAILRRPSDPRLRASAVVALGGIDHADAAAAVLGAFDDRSSLVRAAAAVASVRMPSREARDEAARRIDARLGKGESSREVRHDLEEARAVLGGAKPAAAWREVGSERLFLDLFRPYEQKLLDEVNLAVEWSLELTKIKNIQSDAEVVSTGSPEDSAAPNGDSGGTTDPPPDPTPDSGGGAPGSGERSIGNTTPAVAARTSVWQELRDLKLELLRRPLFGLEDLPKR